jgi:hypothetical protein
MTSHLPVSLSYWFFSFKEEDCLYNATCMLQYELVKGFFKRNFDYVLACGFKSLDIL